MPDQARYEALSALRDAEDLSRNEPPSERAFADRVKSLLVYLVDYKMINTQWEGSNFWIDNTFETDPSVLNHAQALGGEEFFRDCDEIQREFELAERRDRRDKHELAEQLSLYFIALRLGFKGQYHDRPQELEDYTRRLFTRLPAYATTRANEIFPEALRHNQEIKVNYNLGLSTTVVLVSFLVLVFVAIFAFQTAWHSAVGDISDVAQQWQDEETSTAAVNGTGSQ